MNRNLYRILATVWAETGVSLEAMQATERQKRTVMARRLFVGLARALTPCSFPEIQRVLSDSCHSSSVDRHQQHERELRVNADYSLTYWKLYRQLRQTEAA